jgi:hypothetical protein
MDWVARPRAATAQMTPRDNYFPLKPYCQIGLTTIGTKDGLDLSPDLSGVVMLAMAKASAKLEERDFGLPDSILARRSINDGLL